MTEDDKSKRKPGAKSGTPRTHGPGAGKQAGQKFPKRKEGEFLARRNFKHTDKPEQEETGERPFRKGPRSEGRPFAKREGREGDERPFRSRDRDGAQRRDEGHRREDRPQRGERKFGSRDEKRSNRPQRGFSDDRKPAGQFRPRPPRSFSDEQESSERIARRLARAGIASRRDAEDLIAAGRVRVNGVVLETPAFNVKAADVIFVDGVEIPPIERTRLFLFHKPAGVVTTNRDPEGRRTVFDVLPADLPRLMTVGRLDINTEGLLLFTNDGGLARVLELPATGWLRRYRVRVHGAVDEKALADLKNGIAVDGVFYGGAEATLERVQGSNAWLNVGLREGKNREVRNILGALGLEVNRLIRVSYGPFQLGELPEGHVLEIKGRTLREQLGERLIEESGANFDAGIVKPFSNKPVRQERRPDGDATEMQPAVRKPARLDIGEGGLIKRRKMREGGRDEALGKLSTRPTKPGFGARPERSRTEYGKGEGRKGGPHRKEGPPLEPPGQRKANVWMAPGARPLRERDAGADNRDYENRRDHENKRDHRDNKASHKPARRDGPHRGPAPRGPAKGPKRS
ncbi:pseudouridine synthase [Aquamicrobium segne]|uniref:Pseudouridine synthase n=1 Tax=Aquamicrobium segne TaxID=469547 RepID=A0ABW0H1W4_9HYPH